MSGKTYVIEGKYSSGSGSEWEVIDTVTPEDGGMQEAQRLVGEYRLAHSPAPIRYRPAKPEDLS